MYFESAVFVPLLQNLVEVLEQVDEQNLPGRSSADEQIAGEWMELHGGDLMLHEDGEERRHLVLAVPEGNLLDGAAAHALQTLLKCLATCVRDEEHFVKAGTPEDVGYGLGLVVLVGFGRVTVRGRVECLHVFVQVRYGQPASVSCAAYA